MTSDGVVQVAWIVSGTTLVQFVLTRVFNRMDAREIRKDIAATHDEVKVVAHNVDGILHAATAGELKATGELQHALGKEEGTNKERDRP